MVKCNGSEIQQVILNLIVNSAHAIAEFIKGSNNRGTIFIETESNEEDVVITITDTGGGIPLHIQDKIFDPFFTTKEVGKGTGQGLAISRPIINENHGGSLTFKSEEGVGTAFYIRIPVNGKSTTLIAPTEEQRIE